MSSPDVSTGIVNDPLANVNLIRDNLRDRYRSGFPVLKELIQNADDAGASAFDVGWTPGLRGADHPLLNSPALFVVNDGPFAAHHAQAVPRLGLSGRAGERATIGKFGLGLKSVFHLCEAFFYLGSPDPVEDAKASRYPRRNILNPWHASDGSGLHKEWDHFTGAAQRSIEDHLAPLLPAGQWLCLWIPLRQHAHARDFAIEDHYPGDTPELPDGVLTADVPGQLCSILPLLRRLQHIRGWRVTGGHFQPLFEVGLEPDSIRRHFAGESVPISSPLGGRVRLRTPASADASGSDTRHAYVGHEHTLEAPEFVALQRDGRWPRLSSRHPVTRVPIEEPDKAAPHAAVIFMHGRGGGRLRLVESVFLPVGHPPSPILTRLPFDVDVVLHSYSFVDAGRSQIKRLSPEADGSDAVQGRWNHLLAERGLYPLVLPALNRFVREEGFTVDQTELLTAGLAQTSLIREHRASVCREQQWVRCLADQGETWVWDLRPATEPVYAIPPSVASDPRRYLSVLTALRRICANVTITLTEERCRLAADPLSAWPEDLSLGLLEDIPLGEVFADQGKLDYLNSFLDCVFASAAPSPAVASRLVVMAQEAIGTVGFAALRGVLQRFLRFVRFIPCDRRSTLGMPSDRHPDELAGLAALVPGLLLLPSDMVPDDARSTAVLSPDDGAPLLRWLANDTRRVAPSARSELAIVILKNVRERDGLLARCRGLLLFEAHDLQQGHEVPVSLDVFEETLGRGVLFLYGAPPTPRARASELQSALAHERVLLVRTEIASLLLGDGAVGQCSADGCAQALAFRPTLAAPEQRGELLTLLLGQVNADASASIRRACRYLLHGDAAHFDDDSTLLAHGHGEQKLWVRLASAALQLEANAWRVIRDEIASRVPPIHHGPLGVATLDAKGVGSVLAGRDLGSIDCSIFEPEERAAIVAGISEDGVASRLRIHEAAAGGLVDLHEQAYLLGASSPPEEIARLVTLVRPYPGVAGDRQRRLRPALDRAAIIRLALAQPAPSRLWSVVCDALSELPASATPDDVLPLLQSVPWLPTAAGPAVSGDDVIHLPGLNDEIARVLGHEETGFVGIAALGEDLLRHRAFRRVAEVCFQQGDVALAVLGEALAGVSRYHLGVTEPVSADPGRFLAAFLGVFRSAPADVVPAYGLLEAVCRNQSREQCQAHLVPALAKQVAPDRLAEILNYLAQAHRDAPRAAQSQVLEVFSWYLQALLGAPDHELALPTVPLLSEGGRWKWPGALAHPTDADGLHPDDVLDARLAQILGPRGGPPAADTPQQGGAGPATDQNVPGAIGRSAAVLEEYFASWAGAVPDEVIGAFIALLGDDPGILALATKYLERRRRSVEGTRSAFPWRQQERLFQGLPLAGHNEDIHASLQKQRAMVRVLATTADRVDVPSLLGARFAARLRADDEIGSLFVRSADWVAPHRVVAFGGASVRVGALQLRPVRPTDHPRDHLIRLLQGTAADVLRHWYGQGAALDPRFTLDPLWSDLAKTGQIDIEVARRLILESAPMYLRQLGVNRDRNVADVLAEIDTASEHRAEDDRALDLGQTVRRSAEAELKDAQRRLQDLLGSDTDVQTAVLSAIRDTMRKYQYSLSSVPFEIFQNADDAVGDLRLLGWDGRGDDLRRRFVVRWDAEAIGFAHWGRAINQFGSRNGQEGVRSFRRDLQKMLVVSASDKGLLPGDTATGKFGFGFKTVFLVTDQPKVVSGQLRFKILGGVVPQLLSPADASRFESDLLASDGARAGGTLIELPLAPHVVPDAKRFVATFLNRAHVLLVFARNIKQCDLYSPDGRHEVLSWEEKEMAPGLLVGQLRPSTQGSAGDPSTAIVLRSPHGAILIGLDARGVTRLSETLPTFWVTAPTEARADVGFAVNGDFEVDVGRSQLAQESKLNEDRASSLGDEMGRGLTALADHAVGWKAFRETLRLARDLQPYQFWLSVWRLLAEPIVHLSEQKEPAPAERLAARIIAPGSRRGLARFYQVRPQVPTELFGEYLTLTDADSAKFVAEGVLASMDAFHLVSGWAAFRRLCAPGTIVSERVGAVLRGLDPSNVDRQAVSLARLVRDVSGVARAVNAEMASQFGSLITPAFLNQLEHGRGAPEAESLRELVEEMQFLGTDDRWHRARDLLLTEEVDADAREERARAAFAPAARVLSAQYGSTGVQFFRACRRSMNAPVQEMGQWAIETEDLNRRRAAVAYLVNGAQADELGRWLQSRIEGTWLAGLRFDRSAMDEVLPADQPIVLARLRLLPEQMAWISPVLAHIQREPREILADIHAWWVEEGDQHVRDYEKRIYPHGQPPGSLAVFQPGDLASRRNWLILLLLGAFHTMGRAQLEQHRGFLELCQREGWLDVFAEGAITPSDWLGVLERMVRDASQHIPYYEWAKQFVSIYLLASNLEDYVESFLGMDKYQEPVLLSEVMASRAHWRMRSGVDAPPLQQVLSMGGCVVTRELVRLGVLTNPLVFRHCYAPVQSIRLLFAQKLGLRVEALVDQSAHVYEFLVEHLGKERATFDRCFDLPFRIIARSPELRMRFFDADADNIEQTELEDDAP